MKRTRLILAATGLSLALSLNLVAAKADLKPADKGTMQLAKGGQQGGGQQGGGQQGGGQQGGQR